MLPVFFFFSFLGCGSSRHAQSSKGPFPQHPEKSIESLIQTPAPTTGRVERAMFTDEVDPAAPAPFASSPRLAGSPRPGTGGAVFGGGRPGSNGGLKGMLSAAAAAQGSRPATQQSRRW